MRDVADKPHVVEPAAVILTLTQFVTQPAPASTPTRQKPTPASLSRSKPKPLAKIPQTALFAPPSSVPQKKPIKPTADPKTKMIPPIARPSKLPRITKKNKKREYKTVGRKKEPGKKRKKKATSARSQASAQRRFIRHNLKRIMRISQQTLLNLGLPRVRSHHRNVRATVHFRLHPDGHISTLYLSQRSGIPAIDRRTLQVIRRAHRRYPRPPMTVSVRITMRYGL